MRDASPPARQCLRDNNLGVDGDVIGWRNSVTTHYDTDVNTPRRTKIPALAVLAIPLLLAGCGTNIEPTQGELRAAWESTNVAPVDYKRDILAFMRTYLNDPSQVKDGAVSTPVRKTLPGDPAERIVSCLRYNAKKSSGAYAGVKTGVVVYGSGKLDRFIDAPKIAQAICDGAAYEPFPELGRLTRQ
jgi:hypothetical protein